MKRLKVVVIILLACLAQQVSAQKIVMYKSFGNTYYMLSDSILLSPKQVSSVLFSHQVAYAEFKKALNWSHWAAATGVTGALMIAIPVTGALFADRQDWWIAAVGIGLVGAALYENQVYKARALYSIDLYNEDLPQKSSRLKPELQFYGTGARLVIRF